MKIFEILDERIVDPIRLGQRAATKYGKDAEYGFWAPAEKGKHIPLTSFNSDIADAIDDKRYEILQDVFNGNTNNYRDAFKSKIMNIRDLKATQPYVRTDDVEQLKSKITNTLPSNIRVATYHDDDYILDGHHAVMAAKLRGDTTVPVSHMNFDEF